MKRIREENVSRSQYNNMIQKERYKTDDEYKFKVKMRYYMNRYNSHQEVHDIVQNPDLSNKEKFMKVKLFSISEKYL